MFLNTIFHIPQKTDSCGNRFQETHGIKALHLIGGGGGDQTDIHTFEINGEFPDIMTAESESLW